MASSSGGKFEPVRAPRNSSRAYALHGRAARDDLADSSCLLRRPGSERRRSSPSGARWTAGLSPASRSMYEGQRPGHVLELHRSGDPPDRPEWAPLPCGASESRAQCCRSGRPSRSTRPGSRSASRSSSCWMTTRSITNHICHDSLGFFLERMPRNVTLAISTRSDPPIQMAKLAPSRSCWSFVPSTSASPRPNLPPSSTRSWTSDLSTETLSVLHKRTEGWPVGVIWRRCRWLTSEPIAARFVERFGGASRHIVDYLTEVVLELSTRSDTGSCSRRRFSTGCRSSLRRGHREAGLRRKAGRARACQPVPDTTRRPPGVVSLPRVIRGRAPEPMLQSDPELLVRVHRRASEWLGRRATLRGRASRRCRRRARERDHIGVGRMASLVRT